MKNQEELQDAADRAFELLEQKSPHQLAVELAVLQRKYNAAMDMLCEARISVEFRHNTTTNFGGTVTTGRLLETIDALLAGELREERITKPARIGCVVFQPGIKVSSVIEAAYRAAEEHEPNPTAFYALQDAILVGAPKPEGGV